MSKMQNKRHLQATFSKRRMGLFKKYSELSTLCGAKALLIVFSPTEKVFSFGHPNVDEMVDHFLNIPNSSSSKKLSIEMKDDQPLPHISETNAQLAEAEKLLMIAKQHGETIAQAMKAGQEERWWERPLKEMNYQQLELVIRSLKNVQALVAHRTAEISPPSLDGQSPMCPHH